MRISRQHAFMQVAEVFAMRSTCFRGNVGAIVVRNNDIVSTGYNGAPSGHAHCQGNECKLTEKGGCMQSVHAEWNAINRACEKLGENYFDGMGCDLYSTYSPCLECAKLIGARMIRNLFYRYKYRDPAGMIHLEKRDDIGLYRVTPAGYLVDHRENRICEESKFYDA